MPLITCGPLAGLHTVFMCLSGCWQHIKAIWTGGLGAHLWPLRVTEHLGQQELSFWDFLSVSKCLQNQEIPQIVYILTVSSVKLNHSESPVTTWGCCDVLLVLCVACSMLLWSSSFENIYYYFITSFFSGQKITIIPVTIVILPWAAVCLFFFSVDQSEAVFLTCWPLCCDNGKEPLLSRKQ